MIRYTVADMKLTRWEVCLILTTGTALGGFIGAFVGKLFLW